MQPDEIITQVDKLYEINNKQLKLGNGIIGYRIQLTVKWMINRYNLVSTINETIIMIQQTQTIACNTLFSTSNIEGWEIIIDINEMIVHYNRAEREYWNLMTFISNMCISESKSITIINQTITESTWMYFAIEKLFFEGFLSLNQRVSDSIVLLNWKHCWNKYLPPLLYFVKNTMTNIELFVSGKSS